MGRNLKIKDLNPAIKCSGANVHYDEYKNLLMNAVKIKGLKYDIETFVKESLIENGSVGYDRLTDKWANVYGEGLNELGNPTTLTFVLRNGKTFTREAYYDPSIVGAYRIMALPIGFSMGAMINETCKFMANCDEAIKQNIDACKTPYIVVCKDKDLQFSLEHAIQQKQEGQAVIVVSEDLGEGLKSINIGVDYLADKFITIRDQERDRLLNKLGIMSANINKRERVQVGEVNATVGQCSDYIYMLIDTFNNQMETYGLPYVMEINGSLEELYEEDVEEQDDQEAKEGVIND